MSFACQCGRPKGRDSDLACVGCWERLDPKLRADFIDRATNKRGAPSYYAALRKVQRALAEVRKASGAPS